jgi:lambda family phage tail tape measure protein
MRAIDVNINLIKANEELKSIIEENSATIAASKTEGKTDLEIAFNKSALLAATEFKKILQTGGSLKNLNDLGDATANTILKIRAAGINREIGQQQASKTELRGKESATLIEGARAKLQGELQDKEKIQTLNDAITQQEVTRLGAINAITNAGNKETLQQQADLENAILGNKQYLEQLGYLNAISNAIEAGLSGEANKQSALLALVVERQKGERDNKGIQDRLKLFDQQQAIEKSIRDEKLKNNELTQRFNDQALTNDKSILDLKVSQNRITDEEAQKEKFALETRSVVLDYEKAILKVQDDRANSLAQIDALIQKTKENQGDTTGLETNKKAMESRYTREIELIATTKAAKDDLIAQDSIMSVHQKGMEEVFKSSFTSMADALVEFAKTGKLNFQSLIQDMLANLLKFELEYQASQLYKGMNAESGGNGVLGFFKGLLGPQGGYGGGVGSTSSYVNAGGGDGSLLASAKGSAWDMGVQKFAKGGLVTNPTLFKFASGTGLMGEAGPEAIMPLKRDGKGNLGVTTGASHPKVDVVVNNYSNQQATTNETIDSRGNRKIEVIVGDMVADQLGKAGSNAQQAMTMNYGTRPTLVRR